MTKTLIRMAILASLLLTALISLLAFPDEALDTPAYVCAFLQSKVITATALVAFRVLYSYWRDTDPNISRFDHKD